MRKINKKLVWLMLVLGVCSMDLHADEANECLHASTKTLQKKAEPYQVEIRQAAKRYDVSPALIKAVIAAGSCFEPAAASDSGAIGLMQLMPDTAKRFGALDVFDPNANIDAGTRYLSYLQKRYQSSIAEVVTAYSANEGWEWQHEAITTPFKAARETATRILGVWLQLENNKKANRQALLLLEDWGKSEQDYHQALLALPPTNEQKANAKWLKAWIAKVHYPRTQELRGCGGLSGKAMEAKAAPYQDIIKRAAKRHAISPALIKSVIAAESCYREMVVSPKGAAGLMQLMPATAEELGVFDIFDPEENINAGSRYLGYLLRMYNGSITHAIAAYNAGAGRIERGAPVTISFTETRGYIQNVLTNLVRLEKGGQAAQAAQLLLADWGRAEENYQAGLRGESLESTSLAQGMSDDVSMQPAAVAPSSTEILPQGQQVALHEQPSVPPAAGQQPELALAYLRSEKAADTLKQPDAQPSAKLISALDQGIVRVKRISAVTESEQPMAMAMPVAETVEAGAGVAPAALNEAVGREAVDVAPAPVGLPRCDIFPQSLFMFAQLQGNGRYGAFFYTVQAGETLESIAAQLGVSVLDISRLSNISPTSAAPRPGSRLKVGECSRM